MRILALFIFLVFVGLIRLPGSCFATNLIDMSRQNAVFVSGTFQQGQQTMITSGSGFFLDQTHVATCYHIIFPPAPPSGAFSVASIGNIEVVVSDGEVIPAEDVTLPLAEDKTPGDDDFAILRLERSPKIAIVPCAFAKDVPKQLIGSAVTLSGYPLAEEAPGFNRDDPNTFILHTFLGTISGFSKSLIGLQAPINRGSSGSAVLNKAGEVIGIVGFEDSNFDSVLHQAENANIGFDQMTPSEKLATTSLFQLIGQLGNSYSNGIGYARTINGLSSYIERHAAVLKLAPPRSGAAVRLN
jgi:S1-C subfamily serine protease